MISATATHSVKDEREDGHASSRPDGSDVTDDASLRRFVVGLRDYGIWTNPHLPTLLEGKISLHRKKTLAQETVHLGWGRKPSGWRACRRAAAAGESCWLIEDGFLRSVGIGSKREPPLSLVVDDLGIYYDASQPSRLERLIAASPPAEKLPSDVSKALALIRHHKLSKYNHAPEPLPLCASSPRVLVIDQTWGDASVKYGGADHQTFACMLKAAIAENPHAEVWVKLHPQSILRKQAGYLGSLSESNRVRCVRQDASPLALLENFDKVYVVTSQMGFEALMMDKEVVCFGQPWFAGWGLTDDRHPEMPVLCRRRGQPRTLLQLFYAAYFQYSRYLSPHTGKRGSIFDVITHLADIKRRHNELQGWIAGVGMSWWKQRAVLPFLKTPTNQVSFVASIKALESRPEIEPTKLVIWGTRGLAEASNYARRRKIPLLRMEDGFIRSIGLGSNLHRPLSLVVDHSGMYYDPHVACDLETWLASTTLSSEETARARSLRKKIVESRLSKYNIGKPFQPKPEAQGRKVILVPGQVKDDASVLLGTSAVRTDIELLRRVRQMHPDAHIIFKPHPDVVAGNRAGTVDSAEISLLCDELAADANIIDCIRACDEVHTLTSLTGFEALLHGKAVHCYGLPFYAGWGLTTDELPSPERRGRAISIDLLIFGVLIRYPGYVHPRSLLPIPPEALLLALQHERGTARPFSCLSRTSSLKTWNKLSALMSVVARNQTL